MGLGKEFINAVLKAEFSLWGIAGLEGRIHRRTQPSQVHLPGRGIIEDGFVELVPLVGIVLAMRLIGKEGVLQMLATISRDAKGPVLVPRKDGPLTTA